MAKNAKRLAAFLNTEESDPVNQEPAYEDKLRLVFETISEAPVEPGPSGVPVIVEPSERKIEAGEGSPETLSTDLGISDIAPMVPETLVEIPETVTAVPQNLRIESEIENTSQTMTKSLFRQNAPASQVMKRLSTMVR